MKTFNVTLSNNTCLQVIANSMEEVLEAFKMEVTGIVCDGITQCTSANTCTEWINHRGYKCFEFHYNNTFKTFAVNCDSVHIYDLKWFAFRLGYSEGQITELISIVGKILRDRSAKLTVRKYDKNHLSVKVKDMTLVDSCLLRLMEKVLIVVSF